MANPIETWFFSVAVIMDGDRFVLVNETDGSWGLPGGRLSGGESFVDAAQREVREEAGIAVRLAGTSTSSTRRSRAVPRAWASASWLTQSAARP